MQKIFKTFFQGNIFPRKNEGKRKEMCTFVATKNSFIHLTIFSTMEVTITTENFETLKNGQKPLVVDFWATWCGPCRMVAPIISELAEQYDGKLVVGKCDVEESEELAAQFGIRNIPTILFFKNGEIVDKLVGAAGKQKFEEKFEALLA
jgi:thioredoxin 1